MAAGMNVLVITLDTTRADRLGCYGRAQASTPHLDALARVSVRFANASSVAPTTLPAHASLFTGLYPPAHGVRLNGEFRLGPEQVTLAEHLKGRGYDTAAFVSAFVLDARYGLNQGFDHYDDRVEAQPGGGFPAGVVERRADRVTDAALAWIERRRIRPFLAWVHYFDPHAPYRPPAPFDARFADSPYDGEIAFVDEQLGRILERLRPGGLEERTVIVVVGDHGESLGEHGEATHGIFVYESTMHVPFLLRVPTSAARVERGLVSLVDVVPYLLDLLGSQPIPKAVAFDGMSLVGGPPPSDRVVYLESLTSSLDFGWAPLHALRRATEKFILAPKPEYHDLSTDPQERTTWSGRHDSRSQDLERRLGALLATWKPVPVGTQVVDPEIRERLAALGYVGGAGPDPRNASIDPKDMIGVSQKLIRANTFLAEGQPNLALAQALDAQRLSPGDRSVKHALGKAYLRLGRLREAERALREFRALRTTSDVSLLIAQILILDRRFAEASELLDEAEALDPHHGGVFIARGDLLARQGRPAAARRSYEIARARDPYRASALAAARLAALKGRVPDP
jgi:arylsulfatase A-like enzyme/Flp pilus assembly protein TadD